MSDGDDETPEVLPSHWGEISPSVVLWHGPATVSFPGSAETGEAELRWEWLPEPSLRAYVATERVESPQHEPTGLELDGVELHDQTPVAIRSSHGADVTRVLEISDATVGDPTQPAMQMRFALVNMSGILGRRVRRGNSAAWLGRLELAVGDWHVRIDRPAGAPAGERGGPLGRFALTHAGLLTRTDGKPFVMRDAEKVMTGLWIWASLLRGGYSGPIWWQAEDAQGTIAWTHHPVWHLDPWLTDQALYPSATVHYENPEVEPALARCLERCCELLEDDDWHDVLLRAVNWYLAANNGRNDSDIVLAQAGLELLAYAYAVLPDALPLDGFARLRAEHKMHMLFAALHIPLAIPPTLHILEIYAKGQSNANAAVMVARFRNALIHPPTKKQADNVPGGPGDPEARVQARELSISLLEQCLLAILGYDSWIRDRMVGWFMRDLSSNE
jgi:hypothetical protein